MNCVQCRDAVSFLAVMFCDSLNDRGHAHAGLLVASASLGQREALIEKERRGLVMLSGSCRL